MSKKAATRPLVLVDGSSYLFRAFFGLPPLTSPDGEPTGAIYGVASMLKRLLTEQDPEHVAVVFDASGKTFRDELFAEYKAHRPPMPDDLAVQTAPLLELVQALGFPMLQVSGVEADDVIGTLAKRGAKSGMQVLISTGDKDMAQLVDDKVTLVNTMSNTTLDRDGVKEKFGVWPEQIIDYLALVGDSSDNIPGVPGIGPKTAAPLLAHFGTLDALYKRLKDVPQVEMRGAKQLPPKLEQHKDSALLSRQLATIHCDVELPLGPKDLAMREPDKEHLRELYTRFGFKTWLRQLNEGEDAAAAKPAANTSKPAAAPKAPATAHYEAVLDEKTLDAWLEKLKAAQLFAFDTETTSLDYMKAEIVGLSLAVKAGEAAYVPLAHRYPDAPTQLARDQVLARLKPLLEDPARPKLGHHIKYDAHVLLNYGIRMDGMRFDSMLESYVLDSVASRHDMDSLAEKYLDYRTVHYEDVTGKGAKQIGFDEVRVEEATRYAAEDADVTLRLHQALWPRLKAVPSLRKVFEQIEMPLVPVLLQMEHEGVLIDAKMLKKQSTEIAAKLVKLQEKAHQLAGEPFNLDSPKQLQTILFTKMGIPVKRKTAGGQPSTAEDADVTLRLHQALWPKLKSVPALKKVFDEIEMPLVPVLLKMEHDGVLIDAGMLKTQSAEIAAKLVKLQEQAHKLAGEPFNLDSPKQLQNILFTKMGIPAKRKTAGGQASTAEDVLEELAEEYPLPRLILDYRSLNKLKSTYTDKLPEQINPGTGRVHTSYHQAVAATGRLSSMDPTLQNIPGRTAEGRRIRQAFIAPKGHVLLAADYSQIELR
ncbi:MAG TPA: DNA polymerase I, partial [Gammaproteobacteria bacterium]|nr:DNA polymerase I [Gammaproteobacteria bacterium]